VLIVVQLLRIATKLPIPYYTITTQLLQIVFNVIQLLRITTVHYYTITANYSIITTNYYVIITTNYYIWWFHYYILFRKVIRSNETITTYYFPGQLGDVCISFRKKHIYSKIQTEELPLITCGNCRNSPLIW
jgi:hypothetical protein